MRTTVSAKRCPHCGQVTALRAEECAECGHRFRTRFEEPAERTEAFDAVLLTRAGSEPRSSLRLPRRRSARSVLAAAFLGALCLAGAVGLGAWLTGAFRREAASARPQPRPTAGIPHRHGAEGLFARIVPAMPLLAVEQAAGGLGRVARSSTAHVLLLSYDYPDQSVRVSLARSDRAGEFRVRWVALYHGNLLLHRQTAP